MRYGIIYSITNKINNKIYIGQTIRTFDARYQNNLYKTTKNEHLKNAISKYGIENFEINKQVLEAETKEELDYHEKRLIKQYNATDSRYGYNCLDGGHNGKHNEESKKKIGDAQRGKLNHMYGKVGKLNPRYSRSDGFCSCCGKPITILKCNLQRNKFNYCSVECARKDRGNALPKKVSSKVEVRCSCCGKTFKVFSSKSKNETIYCSTKCRSEAQKTLFKGENNPNFGNDKVKGENNGRARKVLCITTGEVFGCGRDAEKKYSIARGGVGACCRGEQKKSGNKEWRYIG